MSKLESWLRFSHINLSSRRAAALLDYFGSPEDVLGASRNQLDEVTGTKFPLADRIASVNKLDLSKDLDQMQKHGIRLVTSQDPEFPARLKQIPDSPCCLFVRGNPAELDCFGIAIVGTRKPTPYGEEMASTLARDLAKRGLTIVSGLAYGIDTCAHRAVLEASGHTVAVLGCGVDIPYPRTNAALLSQITETGAVVSEYAIGTSPESWRFPARNRIISGLSLGVIVIDAPSDSGALITADFALEQGREIFAVPGPIHSETSRGAHQLLKNGAVLVESAEDVLNELGIETDSTSNRPAAPDIPRDLDPHSKKILQCLSLDPKQTDEIVGESGLSASEVGTSLMMLEIRGVIRRLPGSRYVRTTFRM